MLFITCRACFVFVLEMENVETMVPVPPSSVFKVLCTLNALDRHFPFLPLLPTPTPCPCPTRIEKKRMHFQSPVWGPKSTGWVHFKRCSRRSKEPVDQDNTDDFYLNELIVFLFLPRSAQDSVYEREVSNFQEFGEEGEVWFGEDAVERMVDYLSEVLPLTSPDDSASTPAPPRILDVGTGNGHLLFALVEAGSPQTVLKGIDYSAPSIDLAKALGKSKEMEGVIFEVADLMDQEQVEALGKWDVVCDKGTFDAASF